MMQIETSAYLHDFDDLAHALPGARRPTLAQLRRSALSRFTEVRYPTRRDEAWKYTDLTPIARQHFRPAASRPPSEAITALVATLPRPAHGTTLVFVDGHYRPRLSRPSSLPPGAFLGSLSEALAGAAPATELSAIEQWVRDYRPPQPHGFVELNTALMSDGAFLRLPDGARIADPVHLIFVTSGQEDQRLCALRNLVIVGDHSEVEIVEHYLGRHDRRYLTNTITQMILGRHATVEHCRVTEEGDRSYHIAGLQVQQASASRYTSHTIALGGRLVRQELHARLEGEDSACHLNGLYLGAERQHLDNVLRVEHLARGTTSRQDYKGILDDRARGVFNGHVVVHPGAQRSDARQHNHNLLLSSQAEADTRPQLEIYADDVRCSHGATAGHLDEQALFYLQARAIAEPQARRMLIAAFGDEILAGVRSPLMRDYLRARFDQRLSDTQPHGDLRPAPVANSPEEVS